MQNTLSQLASVQLGTVTTVNGLSVQPLLDPTNNSVDWLSLDEALAADSASMTEVSEGGSVPELIFDNRGARPVLLLDGEELVGAKQNRVLNASILVAANSRTRIPVSCVEQGRWSWRSRHFSASDRVLYASARRSKLAQVSDSLECEGTFASDQLAIWADIDGKSARMGVHSQTGAAAALYERSAAELGEVVAAFGSVTAQVGAAFFVNGQFAGLELVGCSRLFARLFPKLVRSYALDQLDRHLWAEAAVDVVDVGPHAPSPGLPADFFTRLATASGTMRPSIGLGQDIRIADSTVIGAALVVDQRIAQLSIFPANDRA